jgi:hypothetical protein
MKLHYLVVTTFVLTVSCGTATAFSLNSANSDQNVEGGAALSGEDEQATPSPKRYRLTPETDPTQTLRL